MITYAQIKKGVIVHNINKNEPNISVTSTSTDRAGTLIIHTNMTTLSKSKIKHVWDNIYDTNPNAYTSTVDLKGKGDAYMCQANADDTFISAYGMDDY